MTERIILLTVTVEKHTYFLLSNRLYSAITNGEIGVKINGVDKT